MITAKFGSKRFEVNSKKIYTPSGLTISEELNIEETEVSGKKPKTNIKGIKLQGLNFDLKLDAQFVDVVAELRAWKRFLLDKKSYLFVLGKYEVGQFFLTKYDIKNTTMNKNGVFTGALISLSFTEDGAYANSKTKNFTIPQKASAVKSSVTTPVVKTIVLQKGTIIRPKSGVRWYYTAEGALKKSGKSGKAYQKDMAVTYIYKKNGKIVCVNPQGLGWLKVEDVTLVDNAASTASIKAVHK